MSRRVRGKVVCFKDGSYILEMAMEVAVALLARGY